MNPRIKWLIVLGMILFAGYVVYGSIARAGVQCELCVEFNGRNICRTSAGATEEEARLAAQQSACGGNARGMSESIACLNTPPTQVQCSAR